MNAQVQTFLHPKQQVKQLIIELSRSITPQQRQVLLDLFIMMDNSHDLFLELDKSHVIIQQCLGAMTKNQLQQMIREVVFKNLCHFNKLNQTGNDTSWQTTLISKQL